MELDELANDPQSDAQSAGMSGLLLCEQIEDMRKHTRRDALTVVLDPNNGCGAIGLRVQRDSATVLRIFRSVCQQIREHLQKSGSVGLEPNRFVRERDGQRVVVFLA